VPVLDPFGVVGVERKPPIEVLALEGVLERREVELASLFGHGSLALLSG
jgi:hypothetical protein